GDPALPTSRGSLPASCGRDPVLLLPAMNPGGNAIFHVFRVGDDLDLARFLERAQTFYSRCELHPIIGGVRRAAVHFPLMLAIPQNVRPSAGAGIAEARSIRYQPDLLHPASAASSSRLKNSSTISRICRPS